MKSPILGSAYTSRSAILAYQRMVNLYPELVETRDGKEVGGLYGTPGLDLLATIGNGPIRGLCSNPARTVLYAVSGSQVYKITASYVTTLLGALNTSSGPVSMARNDTQVMIVDGTYGYIITMASDAFAQITDAQFPGADQVDFIDQYFVFNVPDTGQWMITALADGSSVDALDVATAEGSPDNLCGILVDHREVWTTGDETIEVWVPSPASEFPFERSQVIESGCGAAFSFAKMDNSVFWVDQFGIVRRADGYLPKRISTHAIERSIKPTAASTFDDLIAFTYSDEGHSFYQLTSASRDFTFVYDASTGLWHERAYRETNNEMTRHRANCYCNFNNRHIVGDYVNGKIYGFNLDTYSDAGATKKWIRSWRALAEGRRSKNIFMAKLTVDCEVGVGLITGQGSDPQMMLRVSRDGGKTWGNELTRPMGPIGEYLRKVDFGPLGSGKDVVFEVSGTDPVKVALIGAELEGDAE